MPQTLDQQRAAAAWQATEAQSVDKEYAALCSGAPVMILTNGLGPALAFFLAKANAKEKNEYARLADTLAAWVLRAGTEPDPSKKGKDLMRAITQADTDTYRRYTADALAYLNWLKRFADATKPRQQD